MAFKLNKNDFKLLTTIAEHRVLTVSQITAIQQKTKQVVRRRLRELEQAGFIISSVRGFGRNLGRPEKLISLNEMGTNLLRTRFPELQHVPDEKLTVENIRILDHQLLSNWSRIHLQHIENIIPQLSVQFLSSTSPFLIGDSSGRPFIYEQLDVKDRPHESIGFIPDGVFAITHKEKQKTLHFCLEVDMGTA